MQEMVWKRVLACGGVSVVLMLAAIGCVPQDDARQDGDTSEDLCQRAQAHVSACFPDEEIAAQSSCTQESATALLAESCDDLARQSASSKADGSCSPLFFWRKCNKGLDIKMLAACHDGRCDWSDGVHYSNECFQYEVRDAQGNVVAADRSRSGESLLTADLPDGEYSVVVVRRDGADARPLVDASNADTFNPLAGLPSYDIVLPTFTVQGGKRDKNEMWLVFDDAEMGQLRQCGTLSPKVQMICGGEVQQSTDGQYDWYMTIEPVSADAFVGEANRNAPIYTLSSTSEGYLRERFAETMNLDVWRKNLSVYQVGPGDYELTFHRVELPDELVYKIENSYDFVDPFGEKLAEILSDSQYAVDYEVKHRVTIEPERDFSGSFGLALPNIDLDYGPTSCQ